MFPYPGGKSKICKWINPYFDTTCVKYVEPFGGAFWNHINGEQVYSSVTYNDLNSHLANVFDCFVNHRMALLSEMNKYKSEDRETFERIKSMLFTSSFSHTNVEQAAMYLYLHLHAFVGHQINAGTRYQHIDTTKWSSRYHALIRKLTSKADRLDLITNVTNIDAIACIQNNDSLSTMFYVDPPYYETEHYYTKGDFSQHNQLADTLKSIKGKFALSYYDFPHLSTLYPKDQYVWIEKDFVSSMSAGAELARQRTNTTTKVDTKKHKKTEVLILNYRSTQPSLLEQFYS